MRNEKVNSTQEQSIERNVISAIFTPKLSQ